MSKDVILPKLFCPACDFGVNLSELDEYNVQQQNDMKKQDDPFTECPKCHEGWRIHVWIDNSKVSGWKERKRVKRHESK